MKKMILLMIGAYTFLAACQELEKATEFNMKYNTAVTVPKSTLLDLPVTLATPDVETKAESEFAVNDTRKDLIEEIILTKLTLTITSPDGQRFSFLKSITVYIDADNLDEIEVARLDNIDNDIGRTISLDPTSQDLKEYIKKDKFSLRVETVTDELISKDVNIDIMSNFFVNAKILGL